MQVEVLKYLGMLLAFDDNDVQAAQKCLYRISSVLHAKHASPHVCGMLYKATVQAVFLFGSESWNLTLSVLKCL